jgi:hypothetical protein
VPAWSLPYRDVFGGDPRPYLGLQVTGINGWSGPILGLIDSGADRTCLPAGYARLMGYRTADLEQVHVTVADGSSTAVWNAKRPAQAHVIGLAPITFELWPSFMPGGSSANTLWGRADFFRTFKITFDEQAQQFTLGF